tara:strand:- start:5097 stop:6089 length:993 start_codon:yes stop_codon:yes gene_type:complete
MADIALRSPQFKSIAVSTGALSVVCTVTIGGILRYTLIKNVQQSTTVNFDIAELARDYIEIEYQSDYEPQTVSIVTVLTNYDGLNGTGDVVDLPTTITDRGFEAYGTFEEEVNPEVPFRNAPTYLIPITDTNTFTIFAPNNTAGIIPSITSLNGLAVNPYTVSDTSVETVDNIVCNIKRIDCTKYGIGNKITYINKYGVQQDLWFFLKNSKNLSRSNEGYKSNTITYPSGGATYNVQNAPNKLFNTQAKQTHKLSSGYYPEFANQQFEELLLSEYVWFHKPTSGVGVGTYIVVPVKVKTSSVAFKTSVNDRLIEYTMEFEEAFDYINNIR